MTKRHKSLKYCYKFSFLTISSQNDNNQRTNKTNGRRMFEKAKKIEKKMRHEVTQKHHTAYLLDLKLCHRSQNQWLLHAEAEWNIQ